MLNKLSKVKIYFQEVNCPISNCLLTMNESVVPSISDFDAVLIYTMYLRSPKTQLPPPNTRTEKQLYIGVNRESPSRNRRHNFNLELNLTMSYRQVKECYLAGDFLWLPSTKNYFHLPQL